MHAICAPSIASVHDHEDNMAPFYMIYTQFSDYISI